MKGLGALVLCFASRAAAEPYAQIDAGYGTATGHVRPNMPILGGTVGYREAVDWQLGFAWSPITDTSYADLVEVRSRYRLVLSGMIEHALSSDAAATVRLGLGAEHVRRRVRATFVVGPPRPQTWNHETATGGTAEIGFGLLVHIPRGEFGLELVPSVNVGSDVEYQSEDHVIYEASLLLHLRVQ